jgi:hypothetical protein
MVETITEATISRIIVLAPGGSKTALDAVDAGMGDSNADFDQPRQTIRRIFTFPSHNVK